MRARAAGFTFIELVVTIVVIGLAVTGVLLVYIDTVARSADPLLRTQALSIAQAYMDEIVSKHFADPDADGEGLRAEYDDVDDYDGLSGAPAFLDGTPYALGGYTVTVSVTNAAFAGIAATDAKLIVVTVDAPGGESVSLQAYRTEYP